MLIYSRQSFENINHWLKEVRTLSHHDVKVFLVGMKADLENQREISYQEGKNIAEIYFIDYFCETSSKTGTNTINVFKKAMLYLYADYIRYNLPINVSYFKI